MPTQNFYEDLNVKIPELFPHNKRIKRLRTTPEYLVSQILKGTQITLYYDAVWKNNYELYALEFSIYFGRADG